MNFGDDQKPGDHALPLQKKHSFRRYHKDEDPASLGVSNPNFRSLAAGFLNERNKPMFGQQQYFGNVNNYHFNGKQGEWQTDNNFGMYGNQPVGLGSFPG